MSHKLNMKLECTTHYDVIVTDRGEVKVVLEAWEPRGPLPATFRAWIHDRRDQSHPNCVTHYAGTRDTREAAEEALAKRLAEVLALPPSAEEQLEASRNVEVGHAHS